MYIDRILQVLRYSRPWNRVGRLREVSSAVDSCVIVDIC